MVFSSMVFMMLLVFSAGVPQIRTEPPAAGLEKAEEACLAGDYKAAIEIYREVIRKDSGNIKALKQLARLHATASDPDYFDGKLAVELALMALDESPDNPEIIEILALGFFAQNKFERAILECQRCMELNPFNKDYCRLMEKVANTWVARLELAQPGSEGYEKGRAAFYHGKALLFLGENAEAIKQLTRALKMGGEQDEVVQCLARAKLMLGDAEGAINLIQNLGEMYNNDCGLLLTLGQAFMESVHPEHAVACLERAYTLSPDSDGVRMSLGDAYIQVGKFVKAVVVLKEAEEKLDRRKLFADKEEAEILLLLGKALAGGGEVEDGMTQVLHALSLKPDLAEAEDLLRFLYTQQFGSLKGVKGYLAGLFGGGVPQFNEGAMAAGLAHAGKPAFGDYDSDGDSDLLIEGRWLYENNGRGVFEDVTAKMGLADTNGAGGIWGDYDNDGDLDIYVINDRQGLSGRLYRNNGRKGFLPEEDNEAHPTYLAPSLAAAFGDLNGDGWLDLYLASGIASKTVQVRCFADALFQGSRNSGFSLANKEYDLDLLPPLCTLGVNLIDYDGDGDQDILLLHDNLKRNYFLVNQGDKVLVEQAEALGLAGIDNEGRFGNSMAAVFGDIDNDGDLDLFIANHAEASDLPYSDKSQLLINSGRPDFRFIDCREGSGIAYAPCHYQPLFADFNNDGALDLFITCNGEDQVCRLYEGQGDGTFRDITWIAGIAVKNATHCAVADVDLDGDLDLFVDAGEQPLLYLNEGGASHWIGIRLQGQSCNVS
ncbi:MAG: FG-GAP-like repeat-containing protein, partial [Planctomycetota bacterium]